MTTAGAVLVALSALALPLASVVGLRCGHQHEAARSDVHVPGADHVGAWDVCRCGAARMQGDRRWVARPRAMLGVDLRKI